MLPPPEAVDFLLHRTDRDDRPGAERLARTLGYLPLALAHAGAYCRHIGESFDSYASRIPDLIDKAPRGSDYERTVFATFIAASEAASALCSDSPTVIAFIAFLYPNDIPVNLIDDHVVPRSARDSALEALALLSLIIVREQPLGDPVIDVHRLVQEVARVHIAMQGKTKDELDRVFNVLEKQLPHEIWETEEAAAGDLVLRTHFSSTAKPVEVIQPDQTHEKHYLTFWRAKRRDATSENKIDYDRLMGKMFTYGAVAESYGIPINTQHAHDWRHWDQLVPHAAALGAHIEESLGKSKYTSRLSCGMAAILYSQGRGYDFIERLLKDAIRSLQAALPADRPLLTESLRNLAYFLSECNRYDEAEAPLKKALVIDAEDFGLEHSSTVRDALRLAALLVDLHRTDEARDIFKDISDSIKTAFGDSKTWPLDVKQAFSSVLVFEFTSALTKENEELKLQRDVRMELRRLKSAAARQWRIGTALYVIGALLAALAITSMLRDHIKLIYPLPQLVDAYRIGVHRPAMWAAEFVIPIFKVPKWIWDASVVWVAFWLAANASMYHLGGKSIIGKIDSMARAFDMSRTKRYMMMLGGSFAIFVFGLPVFIGFNIYRGRPVDPESRDLLLFLGSILLCVLGIFFLSLIFA
jgi:tetratricopeptide (TPR) repeat protein